MTCVTCGTTYPKDLWHCPDCRRFNYQRLRSWVPLILAPVAYLICAFFGREIENFFGFHGRLLNSELSFFLFPMAGVPFLWLREGSWMKKLGFSLVYFVFCYGLVTLLWVGILIILLNWPSGHYR